MARDDGMAGSEKRLRKSEARSGNSGEIMDPLWQLNLDCPINPIPRYELGKNPHQKLQEILSRSSEDYQAVLNSFAPLSGCLSRIPCLPPAVELSPEDWSSLAGRYQRAVSGDKAEIEWFSPISREVARETAPCWLNGFIPGFDGVTLYGLVATRKPRVYFEVGSGNSTKFVRQAISDHRLPTRIISIDPSPRAAIDQICDEIIRKPLEECNGSVFECLRKGDLLFFDGSHRSFTNSDVTVFFMDVLPNLAPGILAGVHDIFLPYDYPTTWVRRGYSEQYLLAAALLAGATRFRIVFPCLYITLARELNSVLARIWSVIPAAMEKHGTGFWFETLPMRL